MSASSVFGASKNRLRGSALLGVIVIGVVFLSLILWYFQWSWVRGQEETRRSAGERALAYADSGLGAALENLKLPGVHPSSWTVSGAVEDGRFEAAVQVDSTTPGLVEAFATGYYYLPKGAALDPLTERPAQRAAVRAKIFSESVATFVAAVPGRLRIGPGVTAVGAPLYAKEIIFAPGPEPVAAQLGTVLFSRSAVREDGTPDPSPSYVVFVSSPPAAQALPFPIHFPALGGALRDFYRSYATDPASRLADGAELGGRLDAPGISTPSVYFAEGDLHLGRGAPLVVTGIYTIYAVGNVYIHQSIVRAPGSWVAILTEKDLHIASDAPGSLALQGTFFVGGACRSDGPPRPGGQLNFFGSLVAGQGIDWALHWPRRSYLFLPPPPTGIELPSFTQMLEYDVVQGRYQP